MYQWEYAHGACIVEVAMIQLQLTNNQDHNNSSSYLDYRFQSRTHFLNPGIRDWRISNPGIPSGLWDPGGMISKTVIIKYICHMASEAYASWLIL